jgi:hypothetical protein
MDPDPNSDGNEFAPSLNPYSSPRPSASDDDSIDTEGKPRRPLGIAILAVLHGLGSLGLMAIACFLIWNRVGDGLNILIGSVAVICICLGLASVYGMWTAAKWGWWLSAWYYFIDALGHGIALMATPFLSVIHDYDAFETYVIKHGGRFVIMFPIALYFLRARVMRYFGLQSLPRWKAVCILVAISAAFLFLMSVTIGLYLIATRGPPPRFR